PREAFRRAGRVAARDPLGIVPAERGERHDARVEPDVADLDDALDLRAAGLAPDRDAVDPGAVELLQPLDAPDGSLLELRSRPDHVQMAAAARIEGKRKPEVALAGDVPVPHVPEPVVHALAYVPRDPMHGRVRAEQRG